VYYLNVAIFEAVVKFPICHSPFALPCLNLSFQLIFPHHPTVIYVISTCLLLQAIQKIYAKCLGIRWSTHFRHRGTADLTGDSKNSTQLDLTWLVSTLLGGWASGKLKEVPPDVSGNYAYLSSFVYNSFRA